MTSAGSPVFLDTNVLVYANIQSFPLHSIALRAIQTLTDNRSQLWISRQILREYIATVSRPQAYSTTQPIEIIIAQVQYFETHFEIAEDGPAVTAQLLQLLAQIPTGGKQIHDANIVATMLTAGVQALLTHNVRDFERFSDLITVIPLDSFQ